MLSVALLSLAGLAAAQNTGDPITYDTIHNSTSLYGTWATGSGGVQTGSVRPLFILIRMQAVETGLEVDFGAGAVNLHALPLKPERRVLPPFESRAMPPDD